MWKYFFVKRQLRNKWLIQKQHHITNGVVTLNNFKRQLIYRMLYHLLRKHVDILHYCSVIFFKKYFVNNSHNDMVEIVYLCFFAWNTSKEWNSFFSLLTISQKSRRPFLHRYSNNMHFEVMKCYILVEYKHW